MVIPQAERFATKFAFHKLSIKLFNKMLSAMNAKSEKSQGNTYVFLVNSLFYNEVQEVLGAWLKDWKTDGAFIWSKDQNKMVSVGAAFESYSFGGNTISFRLERALDVEFPNRKFGIMLNLTADRASGKSALDFVTFKGGQFIHNKIAGVN